MTESYGKLDEYLRTVIDIDGTDLLLTTDSVPLVRYEGTLRPVDSLGVIDEGLMGLLLGLMYLGSGRNLAVPIVAHGVQDTIDILLIFLGRYPGL